MTNSAGPANVPGTAGVGPHVHIAEHVAEPVFETSIEQSLLAVRRAPGLHHVAHYSVGVLDFAIDVLDGLAVSTPRAACRVMGARLGFKFGGLDQELEEVHTGRLIRAVLHAEGGLAQCYQVTPGEYAVGLTFAKSTGAGLPEIPWVRAVDREMASLANDLRSQVSLGSQNPGGWLTESPPRADASATVVSPGNGGTLVEGDGDGELIETCLAWLRPETLSYIAHHRDHGAHFAVDLFEQNAVARYFQRISPAARRHFYQRFGRQFRLLAGQLGQLIRPVIDGRLLRVVLDVEQGAIYYYRLNSSEYLIGVTFHQENVSEADDEMARLALRLST